MSHIRELWVVFKDNLEGLIILSFRGVIAKLHEDRKTGLLQVPCLMRGRSAVMDDGSVAGEVVTFIEVVEQNFNTPRRSLSFLNSSNILFHDFESQNVTMQPSCNYILTLVVWTRYTQVLLKRKTEAENNTPQTHNLQRTAPCTPKRISRFRNSGHRNCQLQ